MLRTSRRIMNRLGLPKTYPDVEAAFHSSHYLGHTARRLEHLASLRIPVHGLSVLEVGAGIGDHSQYYIDRGCELTITEIRSDNIAYLRRRFPDQDVRVLDMETPPPLSGATYDVVHCYGLLYHLRNTAQAIEYLAEACGKYLFLETCVSYGHHCELSLVHESARNPTQAYSGIGCRPTRPWIYHKLRELFEHVYIPTTQPNHREFPLDWTSPENPKLLSRAVFVASRQAIDNDMLSTELLLQQERHP